MTIDVLYKPSEWLIQVDNHKLIGDLEVLDVYGEVAVVERRCMLCDKLIEVIEPDEREYLDD